MPCSKAKNVFKKKQRHKKVVRPKQERARDRRVDERSESVQVLA